MLHLSSRILASCRSLVLQISKFRELLLSRRLGQGTSTLLVKNLKSSIDGLDAEVDQRSSKSYLAQFHVDNSETTTRWLLEGQELPGTANAV